MFAAVRANMGRGLPTKDVIHATWRARMLIVTDCSTILITKVLQHTEAGLVAFTIKSIRVGFAT
jgi:hypothetical protein